MWRWLKKVLGVKSPSFFDYDSLAVELARVAAIQEIQDRARQTRDARALRGD